MLSFFRNIFTANKSQKQTPQGNLFVKGYKAFEMAKKADSERNDSAALSYYDIAVDCEIEEAYQGRAFILQGLNYDLEAIEDFDSAIIASPDDPNLYFGRHLSKSKTGDYGGAVKDMEHAVSLSKISSYLNDEYDDERQKKGYNNATQFFEMWQLRAVNDDEKSESLKNKQKKHLNRRAK
jgi:tetratricopeptide (TPR) repeat protein